MDIPVDKLEKLILIQTNETEWTWKDGWWYYHSSISSGEISKPLFEHVIFSGLGMGNEYQNCTAEIVVTAQAVQQANNGNTVLEAVGWPE